MIWKDEEDFLKNRRVKLDDENLELLERVTGKEGGCAVDKGSVAVTDEERETKKMNMYQALRDSMG